MITIASWNVNSLRRRKSHILEWLDLNQPTVLALQETKIENAKFPQEDFTSAGYHVVFSGQPSYNGVALISKETPQDVVTESDFDESLEDKRVISATFNGVRVVNLYVVNGSEVDSQKYEYKMEWFDKITCYLKKEIKNNEHCVVLGDFNIAPHDCDVYSPLAFQDQILCTDKEREKLQAILDLGFVDTFRLFEHQPEKQKKYSWWDYRKGAFNKDNGCRIDLVLASLALAENCVDSTIDCEPRKLDSPSDHTPVVGHFAV